MNAGDVIVTVTRILVSNGEKGELSAKQLRDFLNDFGQVMLNAMRVAPCDHDGSFWFSEGRKHCGICSREVADDLPKV